MERGAGFARAQACWSGCQEPGSALRRLVGEPVGKADRLCLRERPPGRTERAEGAF